MELSDFARTQKNIWISPKVRTAIGNEDHLNVVTDADGDSIWKKVTKNFKSVGEYEVRHTTFFSTIF